MLRFGLHQLLREISGFLAAKYSTLFTVANCVWWLFGAGQAEYGVFTYAATCSPPTFSVRPLRVIPVENLQIFQKSAGVVTTAPSATVYPKLYMSAGNYHSKDRKAHLGADQPDTECFWLVLCFY